MTTKADQGGAPQSPAFPSSLGELFDAYGWPRMAGRVIAELLLADPPYLSSAVLCERLPASKGHLSGTIRLLESMGMVETFGVPGSRRDHYRLAPGAFSRALHRGLEPIHRMAETADRALRDVPEGSRAAEELARMRDLYRFLGNRLPALIADFEALGTAPEPHSRKAQP